MSAIDKSMGWREVTVAAYSDHEDRNVTTAGCAWNIAEEAAAVNGTDVEKELDWLLQHNPEVAKNPNLVQPGQKVKVHYLANKDGVEVAGVDKHGNDAALQVDGDGKLLTKQSKEIVGYRHSLPGKAGDYVEVPLKKGGGNATDNVIQVHDERGTRPLNPRDSTTTSSNIKVLNELGGEYAVMSHGQAALVNQEGKAHEALGKNQERDEVADSAKKDYPDKADDINELLIRMTADCVPVKTQINAINSYKEVLKGSKDAEKPFNENSMQGFKKLLASNDFYKLDDKVQDKALTLLLKYAKGGGEKKFDSLGGIVRDEFYRTQNADKQIQVLEKYESDASFAADVNKSLTKNESLKQPIETHIPLISPIKPNVDSSPSSDEYWD